MDYRLPLVVSVYQSSAVEDPLLPFVHPTYSQIRARTASRTFLVAVSADPSRRCFWIFACPFVFSLLCRNLWRVVGIGLRSGYHQRPPGGTESFLWSLWSRIPGASAASGKRHNPKLTIPFPCGHRFNFLVVLHPGSRPFRDCKLPLGEHPIHGSTSRLSGLRLGRRSVGSEHF